MVIWNNVGKTMPCLPAMTGNGLHIAPPKMVDFPGENGAHPRWKWMLLLTRQKTIAGRYGVSSPWCATLLFGGWPFLSLASLMAFDRATQRSCWPVWLERGLASFKVNLRSGLSSCVGMNEIHYLKRYRYKNTCVDHYLHDKYMQIWNIPSGNLLHSHGNHGP